MKIKKIMKLVFILLGVYACDTASHTKNDYPTVYDIQFKDDADSISLSKQIEKIDCLVLENAKSSEIFSLDKIKFENNLIYIADYHGSKIVAYDMSGKYMFNIDKKGSGPGEYLEIKSFTVDEHFIYVLDNYNHKIFIYDCFTGAIKGERPLSIVAWDIETLSDGNFIFAFAPMTQINMKQSSHLLFVMDKDFNIIQRLLPYNENQKVAFSPRSFFTSNEDNIIYSSMLFDRYTVIPRKNVDSLYHVGIEFEHSIPKESRGDGDYIAKHNYKYLCETPVVCGNYVSFQVPLTDFVDMYVYNRSENMLMKNRYNDMYNYFYSPIGSYQGRFVSYISGYLVYEDLVKNGFQRVDKLIENSLKEDEVSLLIFYTIK